MRYDAITTRQAPTWTRNQTLGIVCTPVPGSPTTPLHRTVSPPSTTTSRGWHSEVYVPIIMLLGAMDPSVYSVSQSLTCGLLHAMRTPGVTARYSSADLCSVQLRQQWPKDTPWWCNTILETCPGTTPHGSPDIRLLGGTNAPGPTLPRKCHFDEIAGSGKKSSK